MRHIRISSRKRDRTTFEFDSVTVNRARTSGESVAGLHGKQPLSHGRGCEKHPGPSRIAVKKSIIGSTVFVGDRPNARPFTSYRNRIDIAFKATPKYITENYPLSLIYLVTFATKCASICINMHLRKIKKIGLCPAFWMRFSAFKEVQDGIANYPAIT